MKLFSSRLVSATLDMRSISSKSMWSDTPRALLWEHLTAPSIRELSSATRLTLSAKVTASEDPTGFNLLTRMSSLILARSWRRMLNMTIWLTLRTRFWTARKSTFWSTRRDLTTSKCWLSFLTMPWLVIWTSLEVRSGSQSRGTVPLQPLGWWQVTQQAQPLVVARRTRRIWEINILRSSNSHRKWSALSLIPSMKSTKKTFNWRLSSRKSIERSMLPRKLKPLLRILCQLRRPIKLSEKNNNITS